MTWVVIANIKGAPGDAASLAELANRPKSTTPSLSGVNINGYHQKQHVGWWPFLAADVSGALPPDISASTCMLEVLAPTEYAAVQRIHDRGTRTSWERSVMVPGSNTWSTWRAFAMTDQSMIMRGSIGTATVNGNLQNYKTTSHIGIWSFYSEYVGNEPKDAFGWCTVEVVLDDKSRVVQRVTENTSGRTWSATYDPTNGWTAWSDQSKHGALTSFRNAVMRSKTEQCNIVVVGDSNGEGVNVATGVTGRWINKLQPALNRVAGNWEGATFPFIPAAYGLSAATPNWPSVLTGNATPGNTNYGFGFRTATLIDTTAKVVFTFSGTKATLMYVEGPAAGLMNVQVDSGAVVTVDTSAASTAGSRLWETGPLADAEHTITVTMADTSPAGKFVFVEGILTFATTDESRGVRIIDASRSGRQMVQLTEERANLLCRAMTQTGNVKLVIVNLATNDARAGNSLSEYRVAAERLVDMMRAYGLQIPVVFMLPHVGNDFTREQLNGFGVILGNIASNKRGVHVVDLSLSMPKVPADISAIVARGLYSDGNHMTDDGHSEYAAQVFRALMEG